MLKPLIGFIGNKKNLRETIKLLYRFQENILRNIMKCLEIIFKTCLMKRTIVQLKTFYQFQGNNIILWNFYQSALIKTKSLREITKEKFKTLYRIQESVLYNMKDWVNLVKTSKFTFEKVKI